MILGGAIKWLIRQKPSYRKKNFTLSRFVGVPFMGDTGVRCGHNADSNPRNSERPAQLKPEWAAIAAHSKHLQQLHYHRLDSGQSSGSALYDPIFSIFDLRLSFCFFCPMLAAEGYVVGSSTVQTAQFALVWVVEPATLVNSIQKFESNFVSRFLIDKLLVELL